MEEKKVRHGLSVSQCEDLIERINRLHFSADAESKECVFVRDKARAVILEGMASAFYECVRLIEEAMEK